MIHPLDSRLQEAMRDARFVQAMHDGLRSFEQYRSDVPLQPLGYTRTLLRKTAEFEIVVMQWAAGSSSEIHDHGASRCWVVILDGELEVHNFDRIDRDERVADLRPGGVSRLVAGDLDHRLNRRELHRVYNRGSRSAYSLQLYAAPLTEYTIVDERTYRCERGVARYDSVIAHFK